MPLRKSDSCSWCCTACALHRLHVALCTFPVTSCQLPGCQLPIPVAVSSSPRRSQFEFRNSGCRGATRQQTAATPPCCDALLFFVPGVPAIHRSIDRLQFIDYAHINLANTSGPTKPAKVSPSELIARSWRRRRRQRRRWLKEKSPTKRETKEKQRKRQDRRQSNFAYRQLAGIMSLPNVNRIE